MEAVGWAWKGSIDCHPVTFSYGAGESNKGETLVSDGHDWDEKEYRTNSSDDFFYHKTTITTVAEKVAMITARTVENILGLIAD